VKRLRDDDLLASENSFSYVGATSALATNFADNLDSATLRRFSFKLKFDYLSATGKLEFLRRLQPLCCNPLTAAEWWGLEFISQLAPGDFRTVRQSFY